MGQSGVLFIASTMQYLAAMLPAIRQEKREGIACDVMVPIFDTAHEQHSMFLETAGFLQEMEIPVLRRLPEGKRYAVVYSAYPDYLDALGEANDIQYRVRFAYGAGGGGKMYPFMYNVNNYYDYMLCLSTISASLHSGNIQSVTIGNIKLADYKRTRVAPKGKKTLLYLPTWTNHGIISANASGVIQKLNELRGEYNIILKAHPLTAHLSGERAQRRAYGGFEGAVDCSRFVGEILNEADVVLSDVSSAALDAVAADVPLGLLVPKEEIYYGNKLCLHQQLIEDGIVPGTHSLSELGEVAAGALSPEYFARQQAFKKDMFPYEGGQCVEAFMRFQTNLLQGQVDPWYIATRRVLRENYAKEIGRVRAEYEASTSWRVTRPLRAVAKLLNGKPRL